MINLHFSITIIIFEIKKVKIIEIRVVQGYKERNRLLLACDSTDLRQLFVRQITFTVTISILSF